MPKKTEPVLSPMPIRVEEDEDMLPVAVTVEGKTLAVDTINERVEEEEAWWETNAPVKMIGTEWTKLNVRSPGYTGS